MLKMNLTNPAYQPLKCSIHILCHIQRFLSPLNFEKYWVPLKGRINGKAIWRCLSFKAPCCETVINPWVSEWVSEWVKSLSRVPWTAARQAPLSVGFSRQEYLSGLPFQALRKVGWWEGWEWTDGWSLLLTWRSLFDFLKNILCMWPQALLYVHQEKAVVIIWSNGSLFIFLSNLQK